MGNQLIITGSQVIVIVVSVAMVFVVSLIVETVVMVFVLVLKMREPVILIVGIEWPAVTVYVNQENHIAPVLLIVPVVALNVTYPALLGL
jgi:hypothetical protein